MTAAGPHVVRVPDGARADDVAAVRDLLSRDGLAGPWPAVVLVGGAAGMGVDERERCRELIGGVLVPFAEAHGVCIVDGGTDAGVMAIAGAARAALDARGPHVGVAAAGTVVLAGDPPTGAPSDPGGRAGVEPHHTHLVVVPGERWGDEVPWLSTVASAVADGRPSVTVLANGGDIAYADVHASLAAGRPVLVLAGTGRTADQLARVGPTDGEPDGPDAADPLVEVVEDAAAFEAALRRLLAPAG